MIDVNVAAARGPQHPMPRVAEGELMIERLVVVADASRARFFEMRGRLLEEREDLAHPESRLHARDLTSDLPGRSFDSAGSGRHAMEPHTDPKRAEARAFARAVADRINAVLASEGCEEIVLAAPPRFLGILRDSLGDTRRRLVVREIAQHLVREAPERLATLIAEG